MAYTKTTWNNNQPPAIDADNLNKIEQGIYDAHEEITDVKGDMEDLGRSIKGDLSRFDLVDYNLESNVPVSEELTGNTLKNYWITPTTEFKAGDRYVVDIDISNVNWWVGANAYYVIISTTLGESATASSQVDLLRNYNESVTGNKISITFEPTARATRLRVGFYFGAGTQSANIKLYKESSPLATKVDSMYKEFYSFENDMVSKPEGMPYHTVNVMGVSGKYGADNACYTFPTIPEVKTIHVSFECKYTQVMPSSATVDSVSELLNIYDGACVVRERLGKVYQVDGNICRSRTIYNVSNGGTVQLAIGTSFRYDQSAKQKDAMSIQLTGNANTATFAFENNVLTITIDGMSNTIGYTSTDTVDTIVESINQIQGIEAVAILGSCQMSELMPVAFANNSVYNLIVSGTLYNGTSYTDKPPIYIPITEDSEWRTVEAVIDIAEGKTYVAVDGLLLESTINVSGITTPTSIIIGKKIDNAHTTPIRVRNLRVDYGSYGDAEVVAFNNAPNTGGKQLISGLNPKLVIFEGHGIDVGTESEMPISDNMACSTERLNFIFNYLKNKGYENVSYEQIIDWKINNGKLPKRCFALMFDDLRFSNYLDIDARKPFEKYDVSAGLAVITSRLDEPTTYPITANGVTYDSDIAVDSTKAGGWYLASHTKSHTVLTSIKPSEDANVLRDSAIDCNIHAIQPNVMVYPHGGCKMETIPIMRHSQFSIGIGVVGNYYNCRATSRYMLVRNEIGTRVPLADVLAGLT